MLSEIRRFKREVTVRAAQLKIAHARQQQIVAERAAAKRQIEAGLAERQRLLSSIKGEIAQLQAEEAPPPGAAADSGAGASARPARRPAPAALELSRQTDVVGASAVTPDGISVAPPAAYGGVVGIAMQYLGVALRLGRCVARAASTAPASSCSSTRRWASRCRTTRPTSSTTASPVSRDQLEPGDLVFFDGLGHVGIYIGGGQFVHAPHTGDVVKISSLDDTWYGATYVGARRI